MSTVNISFTEDLLKQIDEVAQLESRSRSELIREAARSYIDRKRRWQKIFEAGKRSAKQNNVTAQDVERELAAVRRQKQR